MEHHKEMAEKLRKDEEEEVKLQELVRLQNAWLTAQHDNQMKLMKQKYAKDLLDQIEHGRTLKVRQILTSVDRFLRFHASVSSITYNLFIKIIFFWGYSLVHMCQCFGETATFIFRA